MPVVALMEPTYAEEQHAITPNLIWSATSHIEKPKASMSVQPQAALPVCVSKVMWSDFRLKLKVESWVTVIFTHKKKHVPQW